MISLSLMIMLLIGVLSVAILVLRLQKKSALIDRDFHKARADLAIGQLDQVVEANKKIGVVKLKHRQETNDANQNIADRIDFDNDWMFESSAAHADTVTSPATNAPASDPANHQG